MKLQIFNNNEFGQIRTIEINGEPWLVGRDVAERLGYVKPHNALSTHVDEDDTLKRGITDSLGRVQETTLINESGLYSLVLSSKLPNAKKFKKWVTGEVLPSIRKHGIYALQIDSKFLFQIAQQLEEKEKQISQQQVTITEQRRKIEHKTEVIKGVTDDIDIYTKRNVLNSVVRYKGADFSRRWNELYKRFREVYSIDLKARCEGYNLRQKKKKDRLSTIKYAEKFGYLEDLYKVALKLYETDIREILGHLQKIA